MEKNVKISILCQIYGKLLTEKQYNFLDDYYNNDYYSNHFKFEKTIE